MAAVENCGGFKGLRSPGCYTKAENALAKTARGDLRPSVGGHCTTRLRCMLMDTLVNDKRDSKLKGQRSWVEWACLAFEGACLATAATILIETLGIQM